MIIVHTRETPSRPGLGIGIGLASLGITLAMAAGLGRLKLAQNDVTLADRVHPASWPLSVRIPEGWKPLEPEGDGLMPFPGIYSQAADGGSADSHRSLFLVRLGPGASSLPSRVCHHELPNWLSTVIGTELSAASTTESRSFGPLPGAEVTFYFENKIVAAARVGIDDHGEPLCAVLLDPSGGGRRAQRLLSQILDTVAIEGPTIHSGDEPMPFDVPPGSAGFATSDDMVFRRYSLAPLPDDPHQWWVDLFEVPAHPQRDPEDVVADMATTFLNRDDLRAKVSTRSAGDASVWVLDTKSQRGPTTDYTFWYSPLDESRALCAIGQAVPNDRRVLSGNLYKVFNSYEHNTSEPLDMDRAQQTAAQVLTSLRSIAPDAPTGETTLHWFLVKAGGHTIGFEASARHPLSAGEIHESLIHKNDWDYLNITFTADSQMAEDLSTYTNHMEMRTKLNIPDHVFEVSAEWQESCDAGGAVNRKVTDHDADIDVTFQRGEDFLPDPAMEAAVRRVARLGKPAIFTTTGADLTSRPNVVWLEPVAAKPLEDYIVRSGEPPIRIHAAVRIYTDLSPGTDTVGFDRGGRLIAKWNGERRLVTTAARDQVVLRYPSADRLVREKLLNP